MSASRHKQSFAFEIENGGPCTKISAPSAPRVAVHPINCPTAYDSVNRIPCRALSAVALNPNLLGCDFSTPPVENIVNALNQRFAIKWLVEEADGSGVCTENVKSDHSGNEVRHGWRVNE